MRRDAAMPLFLLACFAAALAWSAVRPFDRFTWALEVAPAIAAACVLAATWRRFPLTPLLYWLIFFHALILVVGGRYTYARVPLFDWLGEFFGWQRNNYDKLGHLAQGFVPAMAAREILIRLRVLRRPRWLPFLVLCICLAFSALYELIEWWTAVLTGTAAADFLGTQGYAWDTQSDMALCLLGAALALALLSRVQDRQLAARGLLPEEKS